MRSLKVIIENPSQHRVEERVFPRSPVRIGRTHLNDLVLDSAYVSQYHSVISFDDEAIEYIDLGSTNGSLIDGAAVQPFAATSVRRGQKLGIGQLALSLMHTDLARSDPPAAAPPKDGAATEIGVGAVNDLRQAKAAVDAVKPVHAAYRAAWKKLREQLGASVAELAAPARTLLFAELAAAFPELAFEPEYRELRAKLGSSLGDTDRSTHVIKIAELLGLGTDAIDTTHGGKHFMENLAAVLDAFASSFVELRSGLDQFGDQVAVNTFSRETELHTAHDGRQVLAYLLGPEDDSDARVRELKGAFADIMIHQVALIAGITEGVRSLLKQLSPPNLAKSLREEPEKLGPLRVRGGIWPLSVLGLWQRFKRMHAELVEEDHAVSTVLFGREFARSYGAAKQRHGAPSGKARASKPRATVVASKRKERR